ncbi:MAG: SemiSWEET transporter [Candidatus Omnitrophota bacterium]
MLWTLIGAIAATLTSLSFIPQIARSIRTKSVQDVSLITLCQFLLGVLLWMIYGISKRDPIIISANFVSVITLVVLISLYFKYKKR